MAFMCGKAKGLALSFRPALSHATLPPTLAHPLRSTCVRLTSSRATSTSGVAPSRSSQAAAAQRRRQDGQWKGIHLTRDQADGIPRAPHCPRSAVEAHSEERVKRSCSMLCRAAATAGEQNWMGRDPPYAIEKGSANSIGRGPSFLVGRGSPRSYSVLNTRRQEREDWRSSTNESSVLSRDSTQRSRRDRRRSGSQCGVAVSGSESESWQRISESRESVSESPLLRMSSQSLLRPTAPSPSHTSPHLLSSSSLFSPRYTIGYAPGHTPGCTPGVQQQRLFRVMPPVRMGRRAAKIATRKGAQDAKKSKQYGRLGKLIVSAVKQGGPNAASNTMLAAALTYAKQIGAPRDLIDRNMKKATEKGQADFTEIVYEVYGLGGVGIVIEALSDNNARAAATVRDVVKKGGAKMADPGSVLFNFKRCGVLAVPEESVDGDELLASAIDAGADDVLEPEADTEDEESHPRVFKVIASPESYSDVRAALEANNASIIDDLSGLEFLPVAFVEPPDEAYDQNELIMERLLELDDVDAVYSNQKQ